MQGHVDGIGKVGAIKGLGNFYELSISAPPKFMDFVIPKGSLSIDGVSLTVASLTGESFSTAIIPVTWKETTLQYLRVGDDVNLEADIVVKTIKSHINHLLGGASPAQGSLTIEKLKEMGF